MTQGLKICNVHNQIPPQSTVPISVLRDHQECAPRGGITMVNQCTGVTKNNLLSVQGRGNMPSTEKVKHLENRIDAPPSVQAMPSTMKIGDCTVTLRFAEKPDSSIRAEVAELLLAAIL